ncbi:MAG: heme exporter protein CcmD [Oceanobacter sp.]
MEFQTVGEFLAMGKHGLYVWLSYGLTALIIAVNIWLPLRRKKQLKQELVRRQRREQGQPAGSGSAPASTMKSASEENQDASQA